MNITRLLEDICMNASCFLLVNWKGRLRHSASVLLTVVVVSILLRCLLPAAAQDETIYGLITVDSAEVRVGPDFAYDSIGQLPLDASVVVLGRAGDFFQRWDGRQWIQIEYGGTPAWVYARLVRTSIPFNSIFPSGRLLPRDANGRVPDVFDLSSDVCSQWQGEFTRSGDFLAGDARLTVTYPGLTGANVYSVIVISPTGDRRAFDSTTTTSEIILGNLPWESGTYTWRVAPYWTSSPSRYNWQQICLLHTGGTFEKPYTGIYTPTPMPTPAA
jgi:uncharacterized protein YraI